jgi:hypothetical protein
MSAVGIFVCEAHGGSGEPAERGNVRCIAESHFGSCNYCKGQWRLADVRLHTRFTGVLICTLRLAWSL